jgi:aryl-alcohol dehydrogenase-like predicted oxidoreductase
MEYRPLGHTDLKVSKICLGTMTFGEQNSEAEAHEQLNYALEQGINFIDTAELYAVPSTKKNNGLTEQYIGTWLKDRSDRDQLIIGTKVTGPNPKFTYIRPKLDFSPDSIHAAIDGSLKRLQTDYVDLYQLHWPERSTNYFGKLGYEHNENDSWQENFGQVLETLNGLVQDGKIRYYGLSNETPWGTMRMIQLADEMGLPRPVSIQNPYSLLNRTFEVGLAEVAIREQCGLLAYSPMAFGLLSGKYHKKQDTERDRINKYDYLSRYNNERAYNATARYLEIAEEHDMSLAQMSLAFVNDRPFMTSNIIGATTMEQLKENIGSADLTLSKNVLKAIEEVHTANPNPAP